MGRRGINLRALTLSPCSSPLFLLWHSLRFYFQEKVFTSFRLSDMDNDAALRSCLVALAAVMAVVGFCSFSIKKVIVTYVYGILGIAGILLPDWEFFDRDFSQWFTPMTVPPGPAGNRISRSGRFKFYPLRVAMLSAIYSFGLYKWWAFVSS